MSKIDDEVRRLLSQATTPGLRVPRSHAEIQLLLLDRQGRGIRGQERSWLAQASTLGVVVRIDVEDLILAGAEPEAITSRIEEGAAEVVADLKDRYGADGAEAGRVLTKARRF